MVGKHKTPLVGWHPPAELAAWARDAAERRDVPLSVILNEALEAYRKDVDTSREAADYEQQWGWKRE